MRELVRHRSDRSRNIRLIECVLAVGALVALVVALVGNAAIDDGATAITAGRIATESPSASPTEGGAQSASSGPEEEAVPPPQPIVRRPGKVRPESRTAPEESSAAAALAKQAQQRAKALEALNAPKAFGFRIATLNVLGSNHTAGKGGYGPGTGRAAREAALIRDRGIDLIGMQEVQRDQRAVFINQLAGWTVWPQDAHGRQGYRLQIAWRNDRFRLIDGGYVHHTFANIPGVPIPYALLEDLETGGRFYVIDAHNSPGNLQGQRSASTEIEIDLINELASTGRPVLMVGDMNEKTDFFCRVAGRTGMVSANGGYHDGGCRPPGGPLRIDWILGTGDDVDFSGYVQDATPRNSGMSDHYLIYADVQVTDRAGATNGG